MGCAKLYLATAKRLRKRRMGEAGGGRRGRKANKKKNNQEIE